MPRRCVNALYSYYFHFFARLTVQTFEVWLVRRYSRGARQTIRNLPCCRRQFKSVAELNEIIERCELEDKKLVPLYRFKNLWHCRVQQDNSKYR